MNCKPGDLAIMTHARGSVRGTGVNVGRICRVVEAYGMKKYFAGDSLFCWNVELVGSAGQDSDGLPCRLGHYPDAYLKRIDPPQEMVDEMREETVSA